MTDPTDDFDHAQVLARCALGDREALHRLYQREAAWMVGIAKRIVTDQARAEDIVHDAFVNIWRRAGSYDAARGDARGWIYSVVRHLALNAIRDRQHEVADDWNAPVSLGLVRPGQTLKADLDRLPPLQPNQLFELTLEPATGSPTGRPTGPIQATRRAVKVI